MYVFMDECMCHTGVFSGQQSLLFMLWVPVPKWLSQLAIQVYELLFSKSTTITCRRWSNSLPYILYPLWVIPVWFIPCIIKTKYLIPSYNMLSNINQSNWINSLTKIILIISYLRISVQLQYQIDVYSVKSCCVVYHRAYCFPLYSFWGNVWHHSWCH